MNELATRAPMLIRVLRPVGSHFLSVLFAAVVTTLLVLGWWQRDDSYLVAESGPGYALGIIGGSLMLLLLLYPLRKRVRALHGVLSMKFWFRLHMVCGILGPLAILYHANFRLGSVNSAVALVCMLLVAGSGLVGRYLYVRIHRGLYGRHKELTELQNAVLQAEAGLAGLVDEDSRAAELLQQTDRLVASEAHGLIHSLRLQRLTHRAMHATRREWRQVLKHQVRQGALDRRRARQAWQQLKHYFGAVQEIAAFRVNERLFALWHVLHLPLFIMMLITGIVHVFVVHIY